MGGFMKNNEIELPFSLCRLRNGLVEQNRRNGFRDLENVLASQYFPIFEQTYNTSSKFI